jgi:hypothetical protein
MSTPVLLVHGTFAYHELEEAPTEDRGRWWQRGSKFCESMRKLDSQDECSPEGDLTFRVEPWWRHTLIGSLFTWIGKRFAFESPPARRLPESVFHWSGDNSETARRNAGELLLQHMKQFNDEGDFHIIAHSHGGSVLWEALCLAAQRHHPRGDLTSDPDRSVGPGPCSEAQDKGPLPHLKSWTTVGTPFMHFGPNYARLWAFVPLVAVILVCVRQWGWFVDFWDRTLIDLPSHWAFKATAFFLYYVRLLLIPTLFARLCWAYYTDAGWAKNNPNLVEPLRRRQRDQVWSAAFALVLASVVLGLAYLLIAIVVPHSFTLNWWFSWPTAVACLWFVLVLVGIYWSSSEIVWVVRYTVDKKARRARRQKAWGYFSEKHLCLGIPEGDEAFLLLHAAIKPFGGTLLPRLPSPHESDFSASRRILRRPELENELQSAKSWAFRSLFLPIAIVYDWLLIPAYNDVFAGMVDEFVLSQLQKRAQGNDITGLRLEEVTSHPIRRGDIDEEERKSVCSGDGRKELYGMVAANVKDWLTGIRNQLLTAYPIGVSVEDLVTDAMQGKHGIMRSLIHTSYFESKNIQLMIESFLKDQNTRPTDETLSATSQSASDSTQAKKLTPPYRITPANLYNASAFLVRKLIQLAILALPVVGLYLLGWATIYRQSDEYLVVWASDFDVARDVAISTADLDTQFPIRQGTPQTVRWWIAFKLLHPSVDEEEFAKTIENPKKRMVFYARLGYTYSQMAKRDWAKLALLSAAGEVLEIQDSAYTEELAYCVVNSRWWLRGDDYKTISSRISDVLKRIPAIQAYYTSYTRQLEIQDRQLSPLPECTGLPDQVPLGGQESATYTENLDTRIHCLACVLQEQYRFNRVSDEAVNSFLDAVDRYLVFADRTALLTSPVAIVGLMASPYSRGLFIGALTLSHPRLRIPILSSTVRDQMKVLSRVLVVAAIAPTRTQRMQLLDRSKDLRTLIIQRSDAGDAPISVTAMICKSLPDRPIARACHPMLAEMEILIPRHEARTQQEPTVLRVSGAYARCGYHSKALEVAMNAGTKVRLEVALQTLANVIERNTTNWEATEEYSYRTQIDSLSPFVIHTLFDDYLVQR